MAPAPDGFYRLERTVARITKRLPIKRQLRASLALVALRMALGDTLMWDHLYERLEELVEALYCPVAPVDADDARPKEGGVIHVPKRSVEPARS